VHAAAQTGLLDLSLIQTDKYEEHCARASANSGR